MNKGLIALGVIVVLAFMAFGWYQSGYNQIVSLNQQVKSSWAQVENQLQRRFDLIPNLVNTVKGYATHEKTLLEEVTRLRSQWGKAATVPDKVAAANSLSGALGRLLLVTENYPNLKANENFLELQSQLEGTENRIAVERMRYNEAVQAFNSYQQSLFGSFFAAATHLTQPAVYFKAEQGAQEAPKVSF
ncbi:MAG: LemA family protein [Candidatus Omnitrophica bacterium]|nr:LemA family protein [Candidatus Omnitrophota bacterium]MDE2222515.1 LemA family protein [Candidatus Omnitrophota bacterium]